MRKTIYLLFSFCLVGTSLWAQEPYYYLSIESEPYQPLENPVSLSLGNPWDDPDYNMPIGFDFNFFGETITDLNIDDAFLGGIVSVDGEADTAHLFIVYGSDLIDRGYGSPTSQSEVRFQIEGEPGSRIFKLEWSNAGFYNEVVDFGENESYINVQLWLFEASQAIEIHFGDSIINPDYNPHDGLPGPLIGLVEDFSYASGNIGALHAVFGEGDAPILETIGNDGIDTLSTFLENHPSTGIVYRFNSPVSSVQETDKSVEVKVFPSLVSQQVQIQVVNSDEEGLVRLVNLNGQVLEQRVFSRGRAELNLLDYSAGIYLIQVVINDQIYTKKVYKQ